MTATVFPVDAVSGSPNYTAQMARQALGVYAGKSTARLLGARSGIHPATTAATVTATGSTWTVLPHVGILDTEAPATSGPYLYSFDANVTGSVTTPDATNPRIDLLSVQISDPAEGDGTSTPGVAVVYTAGTPAASPVAPSTPTRAMPLAQITVPQSGGGSPSTALVAPYLSAAGGVIAIRNVTERGALTTYPGQLIYRVDTGNIEGWNGSAWFTIFSAAGPTWTNLTGYASGTSANAGNFTPAYYQSVISGRVELRGGIQASSSFASGGVVIFSGMPSAIRPTKTVTMPCMTAYNGSNTANAAVQIDSSGDLSLYCGTGVGAFTLDGIWYYTT